MEKTIDTILNKEFKSALSGYNKDEVDTFLDEIITELERFQIEHKLLLDEKKILEKNNFELKMQMLALKEQRGIQGEEYQPHNATKIVTKEQEMEILNREEDTRPIKRNVNAANTQPVKPNADVEHTAMNLKMDDDVFDQDDLFGSDETTDPSLGLAKTVDESIANNFTLQERIEQIEKELNDIKNFSE